MIRKIFALLALVGLTALPSTTWAATSTLNLEAVAVVGEGASGSVAASKSKTFDAYSSSAETSDTYSATIYVVAHKFTLYVSAQAGEGSVFDGWFEEKDCTGSPLSTDLTYAYSESLGANKTSSKTLYAKFRNPSVKIPLSDVTFKLSAESLNYTGSERSVTISEVSYLMSALTEGTDYEVDTANSVFEATGSLTEDKTYKVIINAVDGSDYEGSATNEWTIVAPSGSFAEDALSAGAGCTASGNAATVSDSTALAYDSTKSAWIASMTITWPQEEISSQYGTYVAGGKYTDPQYARVQIGESVYTGTQVVNGDAAGIGLSGQTAEGSYKTSLGGSTKKYTYLNTVTYTVALTPAMIEAAKAAGSLSFPITVYGLAWGDDTLGNPSGLKATTYTLTVPIDEKLILNDADGNQVYPHVDFVAQIGKKKYGSLAEALEAVTDNQTVSLIAADPVGGEITVPMNVTLALGGYGKTGASYTLDADDANLDAKLTSEKNETVTAPAGFKAVKDGDSFTWTVTLGHQHRWGEFKAAGNVFTATCTNEESDCTIEGRELAVTLTAEDQDYTGSNPTVSLEGADDLKARLEKDSHTVEIGTISYIRPAYSASKWYAGDYTAVVTVTVDSVNYELKKDFSITKPQGGYTSGYETSDISFDTLAEAADMANEGDTIYYRGGDLTGKTVEFSSSKNITLDLGGKSLKYDASQVATIKNAGAGTVTLTNGTIVQPKAGMSAAQMNIEGNFAFANIETSNRATSSGNFFTMTVKNGTVTVLGGQYMSRFVADGGFVVYKGGKFANRSNKFTQPTPETGFIVVPCSGSLKDGANQDWDLKWEVVEHTHHIAYSAAENVITATCDAEHGDVCGFGSPTLTVTAEDRLETGAPYDGTNLAATAGFPMSEITVEFWKKDGQAALPDAPSTVGQYEVHVKAGTATAVASFKITHVHTFVCTADDTAKTISVTCTKGSCDFEELTTAALTATSPMFTGVAYTGAAATPGEGFPTASDGLTLALEYWKGGEKLEGAPTDAGTYTVKMVATASADCGGSTATVSKEFTIAPANLGAATLTLSETEFDFDGTAKKVSVKSVTYNDGKATLTEGVDFVVDPSSVTNATGSGVSDDTYTVKITAIEGGNFTGNKDATWKIIAPKASGDFNFGAGTSGGEYGAVDPDTRTLTVTAPTKLAFDDASDTWSMAMTVTLPNGDLGFSYIPTTMLDFKFPDSDAILVASDTDACRARGLTFATQGAIGYTRVNSFTWTEKISVADVAAAIENGDEKLVRTVKVWSPKWSSGGYSNHDGLPVTEYKMEIPLEDLVLALPANSSLAAGDTVIDGFQLKLGRGAAVTANAQLADYDEKLLAAEAAGDCSITESGDGPYAYACALNQYSITYGYTGNDGKDPTNLNRTSYTAEDAFTFEPATLEGYKFLEWTTNGVPVTAIVKGTTGDLVVTGAFELVIATVNGTDQYGSLSNALEAAAKDYAETKTNTVTLVHEIDAAPYVIGKNVRLEIGAFGASSSYTLKGGATLTADAKPASVVAAKGSTLKEEGVGPYTYTTYAIHDHFYGDYAADGAVLTAVCTNLENIATGEKCAESCTIELKVTQPKDYDGKAPVTSVDDQFDGLVTDDYTVGEVAIIRPSYSQGKWYTGDYTAIVTVTVENAAYELRKGFTIGKPAAGYTDGYEVGNTATSVRYDSWAEALAAANAGDTIYARATFSGKELDFSSDKDITVDLCDQTITYTSSNADLTLKNTGSGTVTFVNGTIKQPKYNTNYKSVILSGGKFAFGERMFIQNVGNNDSRYLTVNANGAALTVSGGTNQCNFAASNGGTVSVTGGDFAKDPGDYIAEGYARGQQQIEGYPYHVIEHEHEFVYAGNGNVITVTCEGEPNTEDCYYNDDGNAITLTLNAEDVKEDGKPHGATLAFNGDFPEEVTDADIKYWQGKTKLDGAPSAIGDYEARITVGSETAVKAFKILDRARSFDTTAIGVVGALDAGRCVIAGTTLTVTNGGWKYYSADLAPDGSGIEGWYVGMTVTWPNELKIEGVPLSAFNFTGPEFAKFTVNGIKGDDEQKRIFTGEEKIPGVTVKTSGFDLAELQLTQVASFTWYERIIIADVKAATKAGQDTIEREVTAWGEKWQKTGRVILEHDYGDNDGVAKTTFKIVADLRELELYDGDNYKVWPEHDHDWSYVANDHSVTATCAIAGCRYGAVPVGVEIVPETVTERLCSGYPLTAKLVNAATFVGATDATVGEILYTGTDYAGKHYESAEAPVQPGAYEAQSVVSTNGVPAYTLALALTIREGLVVVDGQHYESPAEVLEMPGSDLVKVSVWKDFTAEKTYVMPENGTKVLDLCGKTISAPDGQENVITNLGAFTIIDSAVTPKEAEGGTYKGKLYGNIVNTGTLTITGGYFDGTITDESGKLNAIRISGGMFKVRPDDDWVADGCTIITRGGFFQVQGHVHQYLLTRSLGGSLVFATCYNILIDGTLKPSECDAREVIFLLSPMQGLLAGAVSVPTTSLEYNGLPQGVELTAVNLSALKDLTLDWSDLGETWDLIQKIIKIAGGTASGEDIVSLLTEVLEALAQRGFNPADFILKPDAVAALTGITASDVAYTQGGELVEGVPVNAGTYRATMTLTGTDGKSQTIASTYTITPMPIADADPTITCNPANKTFQYNENAHTVNVVSVTLDSPAAVQLRKISAAVQAFIAAPGIDGAMEILSLLSDAAGNIPKAPDFWNDYGILKIGDFLKDFTTYLTVDLKEYLAHELEKDTLVEGVDYTIGGVTEATAIGTYVLTVDGMGNYKGSIPVEWFIIYDHDGEGHNWQFAGDGTAKITATCGNHPDTCLISPTAVELVVDTVAEKEYDGLPLTASLSNDVEFAVYTKATVGEVAYVDATGTALESAPVYTGVYTAEVAVVAGSTYTLKLPLTIKKPAEGYGDGFEVEDVRYDTLAEAFEVVKAGGTIFCHGNLFAKTIDFTTDKDVTIDLCGQTMKPNASQFISANQDLTIRNDGAGKVTFVNGTIEQPRHYILGVQSADQMTIASGKFTFGKNLTLVNVATSSGNAFTVTVAEGASLEVADGKYDAKFAGDVTITGGSFWSSFDPTPFLPEGRITRPDPADASRKIVVEHWHNVVAIVEGDDTISMTCTAEGDCDLKAECKATLSIAPEIEYTGNPVEATVTKIGNPVYALDYFAADDLVTPLAGAPKNVGNYVVVMTVGDKSVEKAFAITNPSGGFTDGFGLKGVRYDTFAEAVAAAEADDKIVCYGDIDAQTFDFTADKDVTLDLYGKTLTRTDLSLIGDNSMTISNGGPGTLKIVNGTIKQPKGTLVVGNINISGNGPMVFGEGVVFDNLATLGAVLSDYLKVNVSGGGVTVEDGSYEAIFSGNVTITGGQFWSSFDPTPFVPAGYMAVEQTGSYKYKVINHTHAFVYEATGLTITRTCEGEGADPCPATEIFARLSIATPTEYTGRAVSATVSGTLDYALAYFAASDLATPLAGAPSAVGSYVVVMTAGGKSVKATFEITEPYTPPTPPDPPAEETVPVSLPIGIEGGAYVVSNLTDGVEIQSDSSVPGGASYDLPVGKKIGIYVIPAAGYEIVEGTNPLIINPMTETTVITAGMLPKVVPVEVPEETFRLYPNGDGHAFVPATKSSEQFLGTLIGENGVEGTIDLKVTKPNKKTGLFNITATVKTLVDKASYSFKATKVGPAATDKPFDCEVLGSNAKSKAHTLRVTLEGDSLTGSFDGWAIDGAKQVFAISKHVKRDAILPFVGTWTGAFGTDVGLCSFSAKLTKAGAATVKVLMTDGKSLSCSAKAEVGADGVVVVPVTVWQSVSGRQRSFGFRLAFLRDGSDLVCEAADVSPIRDWAKKTGAVETFAEAEFADAALLTMTSAEFKTLFAAVDSELEGALAALGEVTARKDSLKLTTSTGLISGTIKWTVMTVDAKGKSKKTTVSGKASGIMIGESGFGTLTVKINGVTSAYGFVMQPAVW